MTKIDFDKFLNYLIWKNLTVKKTNGLRVEVSDKQGRTIALYRKKSCYDCEYESDFYLIKHSFNLEFDNQEFIDYCKE